MNIKFAKCNEKAIIPSKKPNDAGFDIYVLSNSYFIKPNETSLLPTGLKSIIEEGYYVQIQERGSTGSKGIKYGAGVIDSNYRGEWFLAITNCNDKGLFITDDREKTIKSIQDYCEKNNRVFFPEDYLFYDCKKAVFQGIVHKLPDVTITEVEEQEVDNNITDRGEGKLGSSNK